MLAGISGLTIKSLCNIHLKHLIANPPSRLKLFEMQSLIGQFLNRNPSFRLAIINLWQLQLVRCDEFRQVLIDAVEIANDLTGPSKTLMINNTHLD